MQIAVTGAALGMGLTIAKLVASRGATVSLADVNEAGLKEAIKSLPGANYIYEVVDVRNTSSVDAWIVTTVKELGKLDGAVNCAGVLCHPHPIDEETGDNWEFILVFSTAGVFNASELKKGDKKALEAAL